MPTKNYKQIKIWKSAHVWLSQLSKTHKDAGESSASMTALASQAIFSIPMPSGNGHQPPASTDKNGEAGSDQNEEEKPCSD